MQEESVQTAAEETDGGECEEVVEHLALGALGALARKLMLADGPDRVAALRDGGGWTSGRDVLSVDVMVPTVRHGMIEGFDGEGVYSRNLLGAPGMIESLVVAVDELCDRFEQGCGAVPESMPDATEQDDRDVDDLVAAMNRQRSSQELGGGSIAPLALCLYLNGTSSCLWEAPLLVPTWNYGRFLRGLRTYVAEWVRRYAADVAAGQAPDDSDDVEDSAASDADFADGTDEAAPATDVRDQ